MNDLERRAAIARSGLTSLQRKIIVAALDGRGKHPRCDLLADEAVALMVHAKNRRSAQASVCRVFAELAQRRIVERIGGIGAGITLTDIGLKIAEDERASVNGCFTGNNVATGSMLMPSPINQSLGS